MSTASLLGNILFLGVQLTLGFVLLVVFKRALRPKGRWGQFSTWLALVLLVVSVLVFLSSATQPIAKDYAFKTGPQLVRTMLWTLVDLFDRDGDGYSAFSIVKDSVEGDSSINVFAMDIPNNGVDEDGVGGDLTTAALSEAKGGLGAGTECHIPARVSGAYRIILGIFLLDSRQRLQGTDDQSHSAEQQDRCEVRSRIVRWGGKSFVLSHEVVREDGILLAQGSETRVWGRYASRPGSPLKGQPITEELKAQFLAR